MVFEIALASLFGMFLFWYLFIEKTFPGKGWFAFSVKDVDIKIRALSFFLFIGGAVCVFIDNRWFALILSGLAFSLLVLFQ